MDRKQRQVVANRPSVCLAALWAICEPAAIAIPSLVPTGLGQGRPGKDGPAPWVAHPCLDLLVSGGLPQLTPLEGEMR